MTTAPVDRFVPCADPVAAWKGWTEHLAPIFEARPVAATHVGDAVAMRTYNLGPSLVGEVSAPSQTLVRSASTTARQGVDHILIQFYRSGSGLTHTERGESSVNASDFLVYDLAQPIEITAGPVTATNILLPRALLGELCRRLGDDGGLKAAYRGGCRACQNLSSRAIRLWRHLPTSSGFVSPKTLTIP